MQGNLLLLNGVGCKLIQCTMRITKRYNINKGSKVGQELICPSCGTHFVKEHYQQVFCKSKPKTVCKDKYWNTVDPKKRNNTTRISPASQAWMDSRDKYRPIDSLDEDHPFSCDGLGQ